MPRHYDDSTPKLGQHWLQDPQILQTIADYADLSSDDLVIEIGPGLGTLTSKLLKSGAEVLAIEFDEQLAENLPQSFPGKTKLKVLNQDVRKFNFEELKPSYKIVTNLPYYISGIFFRIITETKNKPKVVVALVQKEVAQKVAASPEFSNHSNKLAVLMSYFFSVELGLQVPPEAFRPAPKVDSQVLILNLRDEPLFPNVSFQDFTRLVKFSFASPRKTLINNLSAGLQKDKSELGKLLTPLQLEPDTRAEQLTLSQWSLLFSIKSLL